MRMMIRHVICSAWLFVTRTGTPIRLLSVPGMWGELVMQRSDLPLRSSVVLMWALAEEKVKAGGGQKIRHKASDHRRKSRGLERILDHMVICQTLNLFKVAEKEHR